MLLALVLFVALAFVVLQPLRMQEVEWLGELLGPRPEVERLLSFARQFPDKRPDVAMRLTRMLERQGVRLHDVDPFLPWPEEGELRQRDAIRFARLSQTGAEVPVARKEASAGFLITGQARAGKTNLICWLCDKLRTFGKVWVIDTARRDLAGLAKFLNMRYISKEHTRVNVLEPPPGCSMGRWFQNVAAFTTYPFGLGLASRTFMQDMLGVAHVAAARQGRFPCMQDLVVTYAAHRPRGADETGYTKHTLHKLVPLWRACPEYCVYERGFDLNQIIRSETGVIWEAADQDEFRSFVTLFHMYWLFEWCVNHD